MTQTKQPNIFDPFDPMGTSYDNMDFSSFGIPKEQAPMSVTSEDFRELSQALKNICEHVTSSNRQNQETSVNLPPLPNMSFGNNNAEDNALQFLEHFYTFCTYGRINDELKLRIFPMLMRNEAYIWFQENGPFSSFDSLAIAFISYFSPIEDETKHLCELYSAVQDVNEPITSFIARIRQTNQLLRTRKTEQQLVLIVQHNLNPYLKLDIVGRTFKNLRDLQRAIIEIESIRQQIRTNYPKDNRPTSNESYSAIPSNRPTQEYRSSNCVKNRKCWNCGKIGHISRYCSTRHYQENYNRGTRRSFFPSTRPQSRARTVRKQYNRLMRQQRAIQQVKQPQQAYPDIAVGVYVNGRSPVKAIIDTGSDISVVNDRFLKLINCPIIPEISNINAYNFQGKPIIISGSVILSFKLGSKWWKHNFYISAECNDNLYLGKDFLLEKEIVIDCSKSRLLFHSAQIPFWTSHTFDSLPITDINQIINEKLQPLHVTSSQKEDLKNLFVQFPSVFNPVTGRTSVVRHKINVKQGTKPIHRPPYRVSYKKQKLIDDCICEMKREGIITESTSPWSAPVLLVPKKDGGFRFCVDYRQLNKITVNDPFPIPRIEDIISNVQKPKFITKLDLRNGYWQIELDPDSREKTAFCVKGAKYEFITMPFGLMSAPSTFQRLMNHVLRDGAKHGVSVYLDDILILSCSWEEHLSALKYVLEQLTKYNLTLRLKKCSIAEPQTKVLGYVLSEQGLQIDSDKIKAITNFSAPKNRKEVQRFLGMAGWHHKFIPNYAQITAPLSKLTRQTEKWHWDNEQEQAFQTIKEKIITATQLNIIQIGAPLIITTDASDIGLGAVLSQVQEGEEKPLAYASRVLQKHEKNYSTTEKECLAVIWSVKKFSHYLDDTPFDIYTDHHSLCWLLNIKDPSSRLARWALRLQEYQFTIYHRKGKTNVVADYLSRPTVKVQQIQVNGTPNGFFQTFNSDDIRLAQEQDIRISNIRQDIQNGEDNRHEIDHQGVIWLKAHKQFPQTIELPTSLVKDVLRNYHEHPGNGHRGRDTTLNRIRSKFTWPHLYRDVTRFIQQCVVCQQYAFNNRKPSGLMGLTKASEPWHLIGVDLMGPFPVSATQKRFLLVIIDYFTKWTEIIPLPRATAAHVTPEVVKVILRWGCPQYILSDLGRTFISHLWKGTCALLKMNTKYTTPYHPQTNFTERVNKVIGNAIAKYVGTNHRNWDNSLHFIQASINSAIHETTGFTPGYLNFGRSCRMPWDPVLYPLILPEIDCELYERTTLTKLKDNIELSKEFQSYMQQKNKILYDERRQDIEYEEGQIVWRENNPLSNRATGFMAKLAPKWEGPFKIQRKISPLTYVLVNPYDLTPAGTWHAEKLKIYHHDEEILQEVNNDNPDEINEDSGDEEEIPENIYPDLPMEELREINPLPDNPLLRPLQQGWIRKVVYRHRPSIRGKEFDVYYLTPPPYEESLRSMKGIMYFLAIHPEIDLQVTDFSCSTGPIGAVHGEIVIHRD